MPTNAVHREKDPCSKKIRKLLNIEVFEFIVKNGIKDETALLAIAHEQSLEGEKDLANFVLCRSSKSLNELIQKTWKMREASVTLERKKRCRMDIIRVAGAGQRVQGCEEMWLKCAEEILYNHKVHPI